jgi:hypothetical protein
MAKQQSELHGNMQRLAEMTNPLSEKRCQRCGIVKTLDNFTKKKAYSDGLDPWCRACKKEYKTSWNEKNKDHRKEYKRKYFKEHHEEELERRRDYRKRNIEKERERDRQRKNNKNRVEYQKQYASKWYKRNKEETLKRVEAFMKANPDKVAHYHKKNKHKRREMEMATVRDFTLEQWEKCIAFFDQQCAYCGKETKLEQDHVIPVTKGGGYTKINIVPSCRPCNNSKNNSRMYSWYKEQPFFSKERYDRIREYIAQR